MTNQKNKPIASTKQGPAEQLLEKENGAPPGELAGSTALTPQSSTVAALVPADTAGPPESHPPIFNWGTLEGEITFFVANRKERLGKYKDQALGKHQDTRIEVAEVYGKAIEYLYQPENKEQLKAALHGRQIRGWQKDENQFACMCNLFFGERHPGGKVVSTGIYRGQIIWKINRSMTKYAYVMRHLYENNINHHDALKYIVDFKGKPNGVKGNSLAAIIEYEKKKRRSSSNSNFTDEDALASAIDDKDAVLTEVECQQDDKEAQEYCLMVGIRKNGKWVIRKPIPKSEDRAKKLLISQGWQLGSAPEQDKAKKETEASIESVQKLGLDSPVVKNMREKLKR